MTPVAPRILNDISCKTFQYGVCFVVFVVKNSTRVLLCSREYKYRSSTL